MPSEQLSRRHEGLEVCELPENDVLVYDSKHKTTHYLNSATALIWARCDGKNGTTDLERILKSELQITKVRLTVRDALNRLNKLDLLQ